ncbi:MAG: PQQ-binding-like beta-propeller repeat protein, partial [Candidatus Hydrogenedentales bacterium]
MLIILLITPAHFSHAMDHVWTKPAGQFKTEAGPLVVEVDGRQELLAVNSGGEVMRWGVDGKDIGAGQDGLVAALPEGRWTSTPALIPGDARARYVFGSVEGLLIALDAAYQEVWRYKLSGETTWSRATPLVFDANGETRLVIGDNSGAVTCVKADGSVVWTKTFPGACRTFPQFARMADAPRILIPVENTLYCLDLDGNAVWQRDLSGRILSRAELLSLKDKQLILCGAGAGKLHALDEAGAIAWSAEIGDEIDCSITVIPRDPEEPLVVCTGLWGNLYAFDSTGKHLWTHLFRAKNRARPVVLNVNREAPSEILVATYNNWAYAIDLDGHRVDQINVGGLVNGFPVLVDGTRPDTQDAVFITGTLLAHRYAPGAPGSAYSPQNVSERSVGPDGSDLLNSQEEAGIGFADPESEGAFPSVVVANPRGACVVVNVEEIVGPNTPRIIAGAASSRTRISLEIPQSTSKKEKIKVHVSLAENFPNRSHRQSADKEVARGHSDWKEATPLVAWPALPYASFDETRLRPSPAEFKWARLDGDERDVIYAMIEVSPVYVGEIDEGAFIVAARLDAPIRARVEIDALKRDDGEAFAGAITLRNVVSVGTVNGESAADALPLLGDAGLLDVPAKRAAKLWLSIDATNAEPGRYLGKIRMRPLREEAPDLTLPLKIHVVDLRMTRPFPLTLCTWDYVPNTWFPTHTEAVLDGMAQHGVNVFPRNVAAKAVFEGGELSFDWTEFDAELARVKGRGQLLFHVAEPAIEFKDAVDDTARHAVQIDYLRAFRDHLKEAGIDYKDYALYPVDEPGLDYGPRIPVFLAAATLFREADPQMRIYTDPVPGLSWRDYQRIAPYVDVWCPNMRLV